MVDVITQELVLKLLSQFHLSVSERSALPGGVVRFEDAVAAIRDVLERERCFPFPLGQQVIVSGAVLELRGDEVWVHEQHEIGVGRSSPVSSARAGSLAEAVRRYIAAIGGPRIDGVQIVDLA